MVGFSCFLLKSPIFQPQNWRENEEEKQLDQNNLSTPFFATLKLFFFPFSFMGSLVVDVEPSFFFFFFFSWVLWSHVEFFFFLFFNHFLDFLILTFKLLFFSFFFFFFFCSVCSCGPYFESFRVEPFFIFILPL